jgi:hypothetical protein
MIKSDETSLTKRQLSSIPYVISSRTIEEGCRKAGISTQTFYKWLKNPVFDEELKRQQGGVSDKALEKLKENMTRAVDVLVALLDCEHESIRRGAANDILNHGLKARELGEIEERLSSIEKIILERKVYR